MKKPKNKNINHINKNQDTGLKAVLPLLFFYISAFLIVFLAAVLIVSNLLFILHVPLNPFIIPVTFLLTAAGLWFFLKKQEGRQAQYIFGLVLVAFFCITGAALIISGLFYDPSWDGQDYHQPAIIGLAGGWNPLYEDFPLSVTADSEAPLWINHYPKASWILSANILKLTGSIELGKAINIICAFAAFFLVLSALRTLKRTHLFVQILLALSIAGTPVFYYQFLSFYVDSLMSSLLIAQFSLCVLILLGKKHPLHYGLLALLIMLTVNIKFTGVVYCCVILAGLLICQFIKQKDYRSLFKNTGLYAAALCFALIFAGFNPYVTNTVMHGHPFYPLFGKERRVILTKELPANYAHMNSVQRFCHSLFAEAGTDHTQAAQGFMPAKLKAPFTVKKGEEKYLNIDPRTGGFGVMFSGMLLLSLLLFMLHLLRLIIQKQYRLMIIHIFLIAWLLASVLINPDAWWARYVPHFWLFPYSVIVLSLSTGKPLKQTAAPVKGIAILSGIMAGAILILGLLNNGLILSYYLDFNQKSTAQITGELDKLKDAKQPIALLAYKFDAAVKARLHKRKIDFYNLETLCTSNALEMVSCTASNGNVKFGIPLMTQEALLKQAQAGLPAETIPASADPFSGIWKGKMLGIIDCIIGIKQINKDLSAQLILSSGECAPYGITKGQYTLSGQIRNGPRPALVFNFENSDFLLIMDESDTALELIAAGKYTGATGYLRKTDPVTGLPCSTFALVDHSLPVSQTTSLLYPSKIVFTPPENSLPDFLKGFTGRWEGSFGNSWEIGIIIKQITAAEAVLIFSWNTINRIPKGYMEIVARVENRELPELYCITAFGKLRLIPGSTGTTMEARLINWDSGASAFLRKCSRG